MCVRVYVCKKTIIIAVASVDIARTLYDASSPGQPTVVEVDVYINNIGSFDAGNMVRKCQYSVFFISIPVIISHYSQLVSNRAGSDDAVWLPFC